MNTCSGVVSAPQTHAGIRTPPSVGPKTYERTAGDAQRDSTASSIHNAAMRGNRARRDHDRGGRPDRHRVCARVRVRASGGTGVAIDAGANARITRTSELIFGALVHRRTSTFTPVASVLANRGGVVDGGGGPGQNARRKW